MIAEEKNGLMIYLFENLARFSEIRHGVFSRKGGFSGGPFASLNVSHGVGDDAENVERNRAAISGALGDTELAYLRQVHSDTVRVLGEGENPERFGKRETAPEGDALVTGMPGRCLAIQTADCQTVLLYDPVRRVAGAVHSGWRGSTLDVVGKTAAAMKDEFGVDPRDIHAGIGPSLGPCCAQFVNYEKEIPRRLWSYRTDECHFDFWAMTRDQLTARGVAAENIETAGICTRCRTDLFFSYRKEGVTGRFAGVIGIK